MTDVVLSSIDALEEDLQELLLGHSIPSEDEKENILSQWNEIAPILYDIITHSIKNNEAPLEEKFFFPIERAFFWLALAKDKELFPFIISSFAASSHLIDRNFLIQLAVYFLEEFLPDFISTVKNSEKNLELRTACLDVLVGFCARELFGKKELLEILREELTKELTFSDESVDWNTDLVSAAVNIGPKPLQEEIINLYGYGVIRNQLINIEDVKALVRKDQDDIFSKLQEIWGDIDLLQIWKTSFIEDSEESEEEVEDKDLNIQRILDLAKKNRVFPALITRNDSCPCKSGRKYKHCCLELFNGIVDLKKINQKTDWLTDVDHKEFAQELEKLIQELAEKPEEVLKTVEQMLKKEPKEPRLHAIRFFALSELGNMKEATENLIKSFKKFPSQALFRNSYATFFVLRGEYDNAEQIYSSEERFDLCFSNTNKLYREDAFYFHSNWVSIHLGHGRLERAALHLGAAKKLAPSEEAYLSLAQEATLLNIRITENAYIS